MENKSGIQDVRCACRKIVCQIKGDYVIIKCHRCKSYLFIKTRGIERVEFRAEEQVATLT